MSVNDSSLKFPCNTCWMTECAGAQCPAQDSEMIEIYEDKLLHEIEKELPIVEDLDCISLERGLEELKMIRKNFYLEEQLS